jgi:hypothetical protein
MEHKLQRLHMDQRLLVLYDRLKTINLFSSISTLVKDFLFLFGGGSGGNLEAQQGLKEQQGGKQKNTNMQHLLDPPKEVEAERVQWEIEKANEATGMECCDEMGAALDGQMTDEQEGELETSGAQTQKALVAIPEVSTPSRRSKRRASTTDQSPLEQAKRIKTAHNLDSTPVTDKHPTTRFYNFQMIK